MKQYFCYSSALDSDALEIWKAQHGYADWKLDGGELIALENYELVFNFPSNFWGGRVAGLKAKPGSKVYGVLFSVEDEDWPAVEHKEGIRTGASIALELKLSSKKHGEVVATAFTTHPSREGDIGPLSKNFLQVLQKAYQKWDFPKDALDALAIETDD